jgi:CubicO group peptidase (beta-lactamase class C family)
MTKLVDRLRELVASGIEKGVFPGAVVSVRQKGAPVLFEAFGHAEITPTRRPMQRDMLFDVASLTKVIATLPAVLRSVSMGRLDLDRPVADYLPEWAREESRRFVTLTHLLTHTSGLPAWRPYYLKLRSSGDYLKQICCEPLEYTPGSRVVYSDLGLQLTGFLLERVWQKPLEDICQELVFEPLELERTGFAPGASVAPEGVVATEAGNPFERQMCLEYTAKCKASELPPGAFHVTEQDVFALPWRTETICGAVHDGNCFYGLGGVSGHAGLFSTAEDVAKYLAMWRAEGQVKGLQYLDRALVRSAVANRTQGLNLGRGLGFDMAYKPGVFGHTGFTGTSMWYDPDTDTEAVVLTNRVHPQVQAGIVEWRREFHSTLFQ